MALEQFFQDMTPEYGMNDDVALSKSWNSNSKSLPIDESEEIDDDSGGFDCNICLDFVQDPVVTLCGHLYCWPCIYKWIHNKSISSENTDHQEPRCPVCKVHVSERTLVPLYGRGGSTRGGSTQSYDEKDSKLETVIPNRPQSPSCLASPMAANNLHPQPRQHYHPHPYPNGYMASPMFSFNGSRTNATHPGIGMFGEMVYSRIFGNSETTFMTYPNSYNLAGTATRRARRHVMEVDRSLSRLSFFLFCCMVLCLLLF